MYLLTHSTVQSPSWAATWFAASQEIPRISQNPKVHYRTHKRTPPVPILGQPNPVHMPTSHVLEIQPNIIHPSTPRSPQWSLSLRFSHQDLLHPPLLTHTRHMPNPYHLILLDFITRTILGEEYKSFSSSLCNLLHSPVTSSLLGPNIFLNTLNVQYVKHNTGARSPNYFRSGKTLNITHFVCVCRLNDIQNAMLMCHIVICVLSGCTIFFHIIS